MIEFSRLIQKFPSILPREETSVFRRFVEAFQNDVDDFGTRFTEAKTSRFIDQASDDDLERIGSAFGPLGRRAGRNDDEYRSYLKSVVQIFKYQGTIPGIREAIAAGIDIRSGVDEENKTISNDLTDTDIRIKEHFTDDPANDEEYLEYTIRLYDWPDHQLRTVNNLAQLADASLSRRRETIYVIPDENVVSDDAVEISTGQVLDEAVQSDDSVTITENDPGTLTWNDRHFYDFDKWA